MNTNKDLRECRRIPIAQQVRVIARGRAALYAVAVNISLSGIRLCAASPLPVGSTCTLGLPPDGVKNGQEILVEGTVIRSDSDGVAVRFQHKLGESMYDLFAEPARVHFTETSLATTYLNYLKVSQDRNHEGAPRLFGVSPSHFRRVSITTFCTCIPLAILPVWLLRESIPEVATWIKVSASFIYAALWLGVIQPTMDLSAFRIARSRTIGPST